MILLSLLPLLLSLSPSQVSTDGLMERTERSARPQANSSPYDFYGKPFYGKTTTDVIVQEGSHAFFHCLVHNLGNQTVSWVRNVDSHMLFIGRDRFVHDDRYELISSRHGRWTLKLKYVGARDAGRFECQVSTVPKLNQTFSLKVVVPSVKILGDKEMYVKAGTAVTLRCLISNCLEEPAYVFWYHGDRRLLDDEDQIPGDLVSQAPTTKTPPPTFSRKQSSKSKKSESNRNKSGSGNRVVPDFDTVYSRGGITIRTQRLVADGSAISTVTIRDPTPPHSGLYNCRPANLDPAHVNLHVIQEEKPAAMQHENHNNLQSSASASSSAVSGSASGSLGSSSSSSLSSSSHHEVKLSESSLGMSAGASETNRSLFRPLLLLQTFLTITTLLSIFL